jgi:MFS family permease
MALFRCTTMKCLFNKNQASSSHSIWPLYGAAFAMAIGLNVWWTTMPFIIRNIGGSEEHVGYTWALNMLAYMCCLLVAGAVLGQHNPRNTTRTATVTICAAVIVMLALVYHALSCNYIASQFHIWMVVAAGIIAGSAMSLFWPFLMSWVSADFEGPALNRRLGTYNGAWSGAAIIGPLLGCLLVDFNTLLPIVTAAVCLVICFLFLTIARDGSLHTSLFEQTSQAAMTGYENFSSLLRFRWLARIALFCSWACLGVSRSQFALLFTEMGFSETWFGIIITMFGICNFSVMTAAGRFAFWHFKSVLLLTVPVLLLMSLLVIIFGQSLAVFILAFVIMGCAFGFAYSSHLYYGACGSRRRSTQMVIHEATLSLGVIIGSGAGGYLAKNVSLYSPYWFAVIALCVGFITQAVILLSGLSAERRG